MWIILIRLHGASLRYMLLKRIEAAPTSVLSLRIRSVCLLSRIITQPCNSSYLCGVFHYLPLCFSVISVVSSQNRQLMLVINSSQQRVGEPIGKLSSKRARGFPQELVESEQSFKEIVLTSIRQLKMNASIAPCCLHLSPAAVFKRFSISTLSG